MSKSRIVLRHVLCGALLGVICLLAPLQAEAACTGSDRAGTWQIYALGTDNVDSDWFKCKIRVGSSGSVKSGTTCVSMDAGSGSTETVTVQGGTINIKSSCKVTGNFKVSGCKITITEAWISKDASMMSGVGKDCEGFIFLFNGIKR